MLVHGVSPDGLLLSTMIPIPKSKRGQKGSSDNYRATALSSLIGIILDTIILKELCENLMIVYSLDLRKCIIQVITKAFDRLQHMRL